MADLKSLSEAELVDRCNAGDEAACAELDRRGVEPTVIEPEQLGAEDQRPSPNAIRLVMRGTTLEELRRLRCRLEATAPAGWEELERGIEEGSRVDENRSDFRVPLEDPALDLIRVHAPHLCRLWPAVFGKPPVVPFRGPTLSQIAERVRGQTVVDVRPTADGRTEVRFVNGSALEFPTTPTLRERPERPSEAAMRLSQVGRS